MAVHPIYGISICSGGGGLELGLRLALGDGYRCCAYVERSGGAAAVLVGRMEDTSLDSAPIWDDVATFDGAAWRGRIHIVSAGIPCQPFSLAGNRGGLADERWIWPDVARSIRDIRPEYVFLENVPPFVLGGLDAVLCDLAACGFDAEWDLFSAADVGAPHIRNRFFLLAHARRGSEPGLQPDGLTGSHQAASTRDGRGMVADSDRLGRSFERDSGLPRANTDDVDGPCCTPMADALGGGCGQTAEQPESIRTTHARAICPGVCLANPIGVGLNGRAHDTWRGGGERAITEWAGPLFPPPPDALDEWREILEREPSLEPSIRGGTHGVAGRLDQLHVLGNGVVPLAAAYAFCTLRARL